MKINIIKSTFLISALSFGFIFPSFALYETNIQKGADWLESTQNIDGSWVDFTNHKYINTLSATNALYSIGLRNSNYYKGVTWLQNHEANNIDFQSRRFLQLSEYGNSVVNDLVNKLIISQDVTVSGRMGWGLSEKYLQSPLDTAIVLSSIHDFLIPNTVNKEAAKNYLKSVKKENNSWGISNLQDSDPVTTAFVITALSGYRSSDASLDTILNGGIEYLKNSVPLTATISLQALSAKAALSINDSAAASIWINSIVNKQEQNGSWNNSIYDTALALEVLAKAGGFNIKTDRVLVNIPDSNLRKIINLTLGRNALDTLSKNEIAMLKHLNAKDQGIKDLTGLELAENLESIDLRGNQITSQEPIEGLTKLTDIILTDNNLFADEDIPFLPSWAMFILLVGFISKYINTVKTK